MSSQEGPQGCAKKFVNNHLKKLIRFRDYVEDSNFVSEMICAITKHPNPNSVCTMTPFFTASFTHKSKHLQAYWGLVKSIRVCTDKWNVYSLRLNQPIKNEDMLIGFYCRYKDLTTNDTLDDMGSVWHPKSTDDTLTPLGKMFHEVVNKSFIQMQYAIECFGLKPLFINEVPNASNADNNGARGTLEKTIESQANLLTQQQRINDQIKDLLKKWEEQQEMVSAAQALAGNKRHRGKDQT